MPLSLEYMQSWKFINGKHNEIYNAEHQTWSHEPRVRHWLKIILYNKRSPTSL